MQNIVIQVKNASDAQFLMQLAEKMGFLSFQLSQKEGFEIARRGLSGLIAERSKTADDGEPSMEDIQEVVDEIRQTRYEKQQVAVGH